MTSAIAGGRTTSWRLDAITPTGEQVARLALRAGSGSHDWTLGAEVPLSFRADIGPRILTFDGQPTTDPLPDLRGLWARVTHRINGTPHVVATGPITGAPRHLAVGETVRLRAMDPTRLLQRAGLRARLTLPVGTPVTETVRDLIASHAPAVTAVIGDTDETLREPLSYEPGDSVLRVIDALLQAAAYTTLAPRPDGTLWSSRWIPPSQRPAALTWDRAVEAPYLPDVELEDDYMDRPDEVIARTRGSQDAPAIVGRWPDFAPPNAITEVIDVEATTVESATLQARHHFEDRQQVTRRTDIDGPWQPVEPGQVGRFAFARHGVDMRTEVQGISGQWDVRGSCSFALQEVQ